MSRSIHAYRSYDPETVAAMGAAFDAACRLVPALDTSEEMKRALALTILRHADEAEDRNPKHCAVVRSSDGSEGSFNSTCAIVPRAA